MQEKAEWLSPTAFSKRVGVSAQAVLKQVENGRFSTKVLKQVKTKTGSTRYKILVPDGVLEWDVNKKTNQISSEDIQNAKARQQIASAQIEEMKAQQMAGELVNAEDIKRVFAAACIRLREGVVAVIKDVSPSCVGVETAKEIESLLLKEISQKFEDFALAARSGELTK